jgi:phosphoribosylformylglycinamidine (FGAM) synthase PurS component
MRKKHICHTLRLLEQQESAFLDRSIRRAENERTELAKNDVNNPQQKAIDAAHRILQKEISLLQQGKNVSYSIGTTIKRALNKLTSQSKTVRFGDDTTIKFNSEAEPVWITYDSGADGNYMAEKDRVAAGLPILRKSDKRVGVANGGTSQAKHVTSLPFEQLSDKVRQADTFTDFPTSLMSVGTTSDDGNISIFTKKGVSVYKEQDVLITCQGEPILIGVRDEHGSYRIPLLQQKGQWQPHRPSKRVNKTLKQANSVYDLPSTEQAIKWMHAVCGYPVKSTWIKAVKAGNFVGWSLLTEKNINKYYPESEETNKGHTNQTRKNVRSTKLKPFEDPKAAPLEGRKYKTYS